MFDGLTKTINNAFSKIKGLFVDDTTLNEIIKDIQRALILADVNINLVLEITKKIKEEVRRDSNNKVTTKEKLIYAVYNALVEYTGEKPKELKDKLKIMLIGLFGSGKTTTAGKLGLFFKKKNKKVALVGLDIHRPAAMKQLKSLAENIGVDYYVNENFENIDSKSKNLELNNLKENEQSNKQLDKENIKRLYELYLKESIKNKKPLNEYYDVIIYDTSGRDVLNNELIEELNELNNLIKPDEKFLVISADIGQAAYDQAKGFNDAIDITGVIITKMDGSAKAGGALTACVATNSKVVFIGTGEKPNDLEFFKPKNFVSRILGMGDLETLIEKVKESLIDEKSINIERLKQGNLNFYDFKTQIQSIKKMGSFSKIMKLIPGLGNISLPEQVLMKQQDKIETWNYIIDSMTNKERLNPDLLNLSRIKRIAKGSGTSIDDVRELIREFRRLRKMMKLFKDQSQLKRLQKTLKQKGINLDNIDLSQFDNMNL